MASFATGDGRLIKYFDTIRKGKQVKSVIPMTSLKGLTARLPELTGNWTADT